MTLTRTGYEKPRVKPAACGVQFTRPSSKINNDTTALVLGDVRIKGARFSKCVESEILEVLSSEACSQGGNLVVITDAAGPDFWSPCYRTSAKILKVNPDSLKRYQDRHYRYFAIEGRSESQANWRHWTMVHGITSGVTAILLLILMQTDVIN